MLVCNFLSLGRLTISRTTILSVRHCKRVAYGFKNSGTDWNVIEALVTDKACPIELLKYSLLRPILAYQQKGVHNGRPTKIRLLIRAIILANRSNGTKGVHATK